MTNTAMQDFTLTETTVAKINGVTVAAGGAYRDPDDGRKKVNLTVTGVPVPSLAVGDSFRCGSETWVVKSFKKRLFKRLGLIVVEKQ